MKLKVCLSLLCLSTYIYAKDIEAIRPLTRASEQAGQLFVDETLTVTGAVRHDKYRELNGINQPPTPLVANHVREWYNSVTKQICYVYGDGSTSCNLGSNQAVGTFVSSGTVGSVNFPPSLTYGDLASVSLSSGTWEITGQLTAHLAGATMTGALVGVSTHAGNDSTGLAQGDTRQDVGAPPTATNDSSATVAGVVLTFGSTTSVYLKTLANYSAGQPTAFGRLSAVRIL